MLAQILKSPGLHPICPILSPCLFQYCPKQIVWWKVFVLLKYQEIWPISNNFWPTYLTIWDSRKCIKIYLLQIVLAAAPSLSDPSPFSLPQNILAFWTLFERGVRSFFMAPGILTQSYPPVPSPIQSDIYRNSQYYFHWYDTFNINFYIIILIWYK